MTTTGTHSGESYTLTRTSCGDFKLTVRRLYPGAGMSRGERLARAVGARATRGRISLFLTPGRAERWRVLFLGGYVARRRMVLGITGWGFESPAGVVLSLREVMRRERMKA